jgi:hypothetical protein
MTTMNEDRLEFDRGDDDIVFVRPELDIEEVSEEEEPRKVLRSKIREEGLEWRKAKIIGLFQSEFTLMLEEDGKILLDGEVVYPL